MEGSAEQFVPRNGGEFYACCPAYGSLVNKTALRQFWARCILPDSPYFKMPANQDDYGSSLLPDAFNVHWKTALNLRLAGRNVTRFIMLHGDVMPEDGWLGKLLEELDRTGADVLAAAIPIKDMRGLTSTALDDPGDSWDVYRRLTMEEVHDLPETFSVEDCEKAGLCDTLGQYVRAGGPYERQRALLPNTGCWVVDLTRDWVWGFSGFRIDSRVVFVPAEDGDYPNGFRLKRGVPVPMSTYYHRFRQFRPKGEVTNQVFPEDWNFGREAARYGARVLVTRKVRLIHGGNDAPYNNWDRGWGSWDHDEGLRYKWAPQQLHCGLGQPGTETTGPGINLGRVPSKEKSNGESEQGAATPTAAGERSVIDEWDQPYGDPAPTNPARG